MHQVGERVHRLAQHTAPTLQGCGHGRAHADIIPGLAGLHGRAGRLLRQLIPVEECAHTAQSGTEYRARTGTDRRADDGNHRTDGAADSRTHRSTAESAGTS